nr:transposase [Xenorhabdus japonica]
MYFAKRGTVVHQYYDHRTQQHRQQELTQEEMLRRYTSHIPAATLKWFAITVFWPTANGARCCHGSIKCWKWKCEQNR